MDFLNGIIFFWAVFAMAELVKDLNKGTKLSPWWWYPTWPWQVFKHF